VPNSSGNLVIDRIVSNGLRWSAGGLIEVSGNASQPPEHPRAVKPNERRLGVRIRSQIYDHLFAAFQPIEPVAAPAQDFHLIRQACLELGLR
jgi:hypothetical protein